MIQVNLLPGGKKKGGRRRGLSISLPQIDGMPTDRWVLGSSVVVIALAAAAAFLFFSRSSTYDDVELAIEEAAADSARYADLIEQAQRLRARRDSIAERVEIIQEIDQDRYVWPHILDEVARALPEYTWLTNLEQTSLGQGVELRLEGMAGNNFALTTFMENLESSPYVRGVTLVTTQLTVQQSGGINRTVSSFTLEATYDEPPLELRETVPLFESEPPPVIPVGGDGGDA